MWRYYQCGCVCVEKLSFNSAFDNVGWAINWARLQATRFICLKTWSYCRASFCLLNVSQYLTTTPEICCSWTNKVERRVDNDYQTMINKKLWLTIFCIHCLKTAEQISDIRRIADFSLNDNSLNNSFPKGHLNIW